MKERLKHFALKTLHVVICLQNKIGRGIGLSNSDNWCGQQLLWTYYMVVNSGKGFFGYRDSLVFTCKWLGKILISSNPSSNASKSPRRRGYRSSTKLRFKKNNRFNKHVGIKRKSCMFGNHSSMNDKLTQMRQLFSLMHYSLKAKLSWLLRRTMCVLLPWANK